MKIERQRGGMEVTEREPELELENFIFERQTDRQTDRQRQTERQRQRQRQRTRKLYFTRIVV